MSLRLKPLTTLILQDLRVVTRNLFFWVFGGLLILIVVVLRILPENLGTPAFISSDSVSPEGLPVQILGPPDIVHRTAGLAATLVPFLMTAEVMILGYLFIAVLMFQESQTGTVRAYRISPSGVDLYLWSKCLLFLGLGLAYAIPMLISVAGLGPGFWNMLPVLATSLIFMNFFGIMMAALFRSISSWFFPGIAVMILSLMPGLVTELNPLGAQPWFFLVPTYAVSGAARELIFGNGGSPWFACLVLLAEAAILLPIARLVVKNRLFKGA